MVQILRHAAFRGLALALGVAAALLLGEATLRLLEVRRNLISEVFSFDARIGKRFRPGVDLEFRSRETPDPIRLRTSPQGFRYPKFEARAGSGAPTLRVACIGDSFTSQVQLEEADTIAGHLGGRRAGDRVIDAANFGVDGADLGSELCVLEEVVSKLAPDVILLQVFLFNDLRETSPRLSRSTGPRFELSGAGLVRTDRWSPTRRSLNQWLNENSLLYVWQRERVDRLVRRVKPWLAAEEDPPAPRGGAGAPRRVPDFYEIYHPPTRALRQEDWSHAWELFEALLREVAARAEEIGAELRVLPIPLPYEYDRAARARLHTRYPGSADEWDFEAPGRHLREILKRLGIATLDPTNALVALQREGTPPFLIDPVTPLGEGHLSAQASRRIAGEILASLAPPRRRGGRVGREIARAMTSSSDIPDHLIRLVREELRAPVICDIGSRDAREGLDLYRRTGAAELHIFEANPPSHERCAAAVARFLEEHPEVSPEAIRVNPVAVGDAVGPVPFLAIDPDLSEDDDLGLSSFFPLNPAYLRRRPRRVQAEIEVPSITLDGYFRDRAARPDVLWIDVEGAELLVLRGAREVLRSARFVHLEVAFREMQLGRPLFPEVDAFLRDQGFTLLGFPGVSRLRAWLTTRGLWPNPPWRWDALYRRG